MLGRDPVNQVPAAGGVGDGRGGDDYGQDQAEEVGDDVALAALDLLARVDPLLGLGDVGGGRDRLGVGDRRVRARGASGLVAARHAERLVDLLGHAFPLPCRVVPVTVWWGGKSTGRKDQGVPVRLM